jgi:hypothetical protein
MRSFSIHADSVSELATSSEPVSGGVLSGTIALDSKESSLRCEVPGAPVAMHAPNRTAQTKRRVVWPLKKLGYSRAISPDLRHRIHPPSQGGLGTAWSWSSSALVAISRTRVIFIASSGEP